MLFNSHIFILLFLPLLLVGWYFLNWKKKFQLAQGYLIGMSPVVLCLCKSAISVAASVQLSDRLASELCA